MLLKADDGMRSTVDQQSETLWSRLPLSVVDCSECRRLTGERDRKELAYRLAVNAIRDNPEGDAAQQNLLLAMSREAKTDLHIATADLWEHEYRHTMAN